MIGKYILLATASYLLGAVPFGLLIGMYFKKDIRREGSGNIGATNVTRVIGKGAGRVCFLLDFLKGALPVLIASKLAIDTSGLALLIAGGAAIIGHMYPVYLNFKGGKGISTAAGVVLGISWVSVVIAFAVWVTVFYVSRYVSLASIIAAIVLPIIATVIYLAFDDPNITILTLLFFYLVGFAAVLRHRTNISRLRAGTEMKFGRRGEK